MRGRGAAVALAALALAFAALFAGLGVWQVERRAWKLDLVARVDARIHAEPVAPPAGDGAEDEYRRVALHGRFLPGEALVQAVTVRGAGFWAVAPFALDDGGVVLVNRGFVPDRRPTPVPAGTVTVVGLLRLTEPGGGFLRANDPAAGRWHSRDVAAIAATFGVRAAPYFVDAQSGAATGPLPVQGLTVVAFRNSHLVYALTWFALAAMALGAAALVVLRGGQAAPGDRTAPAA